jgi:hypothetical protein
MCLESCRKGEPANSFLGETYPAARQFCAELMAHIARLDRDLAAEISKEQALAEKLAFEQRKKQEMSKTLDSTKKALDQDESQIAADKVQLANKVNVSSFEWHIKIQPLVS